MPRSMKVRLDAKDSVVEGLKIGSEVEVVIVGEIKELEASHEVEFSSDDVERFPAQIGVEYDSIKVKERDNSFAELVDDEDGD